MLGNAFRDDEMVSRGRVPMCRYLAVSSAIENYRMRMESESCVYSFTLIPTVKKDMNARVCVCVCVCTMGEIKSGFLLLCVLSV